MKNKGTWKCQKNMGKEDECHLSSYCPKTSSVNTSVYFFIGFFFFSCLFFTKSGSFLYSWGHPECPPFGKEMAAFRVGMLKSGSSE